MKAVRHLAWATLAVAVSACASAPKEEQVNLYFDPDTGVYSTDESAPDEAKAIAALMNMAREQEEGQALTEEDVWRKNAYGNLTHLQSGMICPAEWGKYARTNNTMHKPDGTDVSCNYTDGRGTVITYYAYFNEKPREQELAAIMNTVVKVRHPVFAEAGIIGPKDAKIGFSYSGDAISYDDATHGPMKSGLILTDAAGWRLKARITYPAADAVNVEAFTITSLIGEWDRITEAARGSDSPTESPSDDSI